MPRGRPGLAVIGLLVALAVLAAACGGTGNASTTSTQADTEAKLLSFAKCMRQHGVNIPDPTVDANGHVRLVGPKSAGGATPAPDQEQKFKAASNACQHYLKGITQNFSKANQTKIQDALVKYAQCMRAHGYNMPDPNFNNQPSPGTVTSGQGGPFGGKIDRNNPAFQNADKACRSILNSAGLGRGGFFIGGPGGGGSTGGNP